MAQAVFSVVVDDFWSPHALRSKRESGRWQGPSLVRFVDEAIESVTPIGDVSPAALAEADQRMRGALFPGVYDTHVHLGLIDRDQLHPHGVSRVRDLGWDLAEAASWVRPNATREQARGGTASAEAATHGLALGFPEVEIAGQFLTCPGGYPAMRSWAPVGSVHRVYSPYDAVDAVAAQLSIGASIIKVTLNIDAGPVPALRTVEAIVEAAHVRDIPVVAHVEGQGQALKALAAGVDELAHVPWTELLPDDVIEPMAASMAWVSTLDIHRADETGRDLETALANARRFVAAGGRLRYGTDLGNGDLPVGVNARELKAMSGAGLSADELACSAFAPQYVGRGMWVAGERPRSADEFSGWLASAQPFASEIGN